MTDDAPYVVVVRGDGTVVERSVSAQIAAAVIATILTGSSGPAPGAKTTHVVAPAQHGVGEAARPRLSLREFLDDVKAASNTEKITAIALYLANYEGKQTFSKDDVRGRFRLAGEAAPANIHRDFAIAVRLGWVAEDALAAGSFYVTQKGRKAVDSRTDGSRAIPQSSDLVDDREVEDVGTTLSRRRRGGGTAKVANLTMVDDLLDAAGRASLKAFYEEKRPRGQNEQVAVLSYKVKELTGRTSFNPNEIYTALQIVGARTPGNLAAVFGNMTAAGLGRVVDKAFQPNFKTDDLVKLDLPRKEIAK